MIEDRRESAAGMPFNRSIYTKTMHCPLCGALNESPATSCYLCNTRLATDKSSAPAIFRKNKRRRALWKWTWAGGWLVAIAITVWLLLSDLFTAPTHVEQSRERFQKLSHRYLVKKEKWNRRKNDLLTQLNASSDSKKRVWIRKIPLETFMAYLFEDLSFTPNRFGNAAIYPSDNPSRLILSKYEYNVWPYRILLSLEIELQPQDGHLIATLKTLRRGSRQIPEALGWVYFASELEALRNLEQLPERVTRVRWHPPKNLSLECEPSHPSVP
jgi:hypothetical protein